MKCLNRVTDKFQRGEFPVGTHIKTSDPTITELFALLGMDFVWIDGEHAAFTLDIVQRHVMTAQGHGMAAFYRVPWNDPILVKPVLDMGVDGIIFPMIRTAQEAEAAVKACRYPPKGIRGLGPVRDSGYGLYSIPWQLENAENVWKIMQIEHVDAVKNLEEIMDVDGVDALTVGASDLSASMGLPCQLTHPDVVAMLSELAAKARKRGVHFSISTGLNMDFVHQWFKWGIDWISLSGEYDYIVKGFKDTMTTVKGFIEEQQRENRKG